MPTYVYECQNCLTFLEEMRSISDRNKVAKCPKCSSNMVRHISGGGGYIFKGQGFYENEKQKKEAKANWEKIDRGEK